MIVGIRSKYGQISTFNNKFNHKGINRISNTPNINKIDRKNEIKLDDLDQHGIKEVTKVIDKAAQDMAKQQSKHFFERLNQICDETGQVYDNKGQPLTFDNILDLLDSMPMDFDENEQPIMPTILAESRVIEKLLKQKPSYEQIKRQNEIIERKYSEWRDSESDRRLVG